MRRKGQMTKRIAERDYPFGVEVEVPPRGLGERLNELHRWCGEIAGAGNYVVTGRMDGMRDFAVFRFRDDQMAAEFRKWIEGKVTTPLFSRHTLT